MRCYAAVPLSVGLLATSVMAADDKAPKAGGHAAVAPKSQAMRAAQGRPAARPANAKAPNARAEDTLDKLMQMKPEQREKFFDSMPAQRGENLRRRFNEYEKIAPAPRTRILTRLEMLNSLAQPKRQQVRRAIQQYDALPPDRQIAIGKELHEMAPLPDEERRAHMNSEEFRNRYSATEQQMMANLSAITPQP